VSPRAIKAPSLIEVAIRNIGVRKGFKACLYIAMWGMAAEAIGHAPVNPDEVAEWWKQSRSSCYRGQVAFREAFAPEMTPERLWSLARQRVEDKSNEREAVGAVSALEWVAA